MPAFQIDTLSEFMHDELNPCGGFFFHETLAEAQSYSQVTPQLNAQLAVNYKNDNEKTFTIEAPSAGTWYIDINGYYNGSGVIPIILN